MKKKLVGLLFIVLVIIAIVTLTFGNPIDNIGTFNKLAGKTTSKQFVSESFKSISDKVAVTGGSTCNSMTAIQCDNLRNSYIGKYVEWTGIVSDVKVDGTVDVFVVYDNGINHKVVLHDITNKSQINKLKKGDLILFEGQIKRVLINVYNNEVYITEFEPSPFVGETNLYNSEILAYTMIE